MALWEELMLLLLLLLLLTLLLLAAQSAFWAPHHAICACMLCLHPLPLTRRPGPAPPRCRASICLSFSC